MRKWNVVLLLLLLPALAILAQPLGAQAEAKKRYIRSVEKYTAPDVVLVNQDGKKVRLAEILAADQPVMLDFIYGTCTTICPVLSAGYANLQRRR